MKSIVYTDACIRSLFEDTLSFSIWEIIGLDQISRMVQIQMDLKIQQYSAEMEEPVAKCSKEDPSPPFSLSLSPFPQSHVFPF